MLCATERQLSVFVLWINETSVSLVLATEHLKL